MHTKTYEVQNFTGVTIDDFYDLKGDGSIMVYRIHVDRALYNHQLFVTFSDATPSGSAIAGALTLVGVIAGGSIDPTAVNYGGDQAQTVANDEASTDRVYSISRHLDHILVAFTPATQVDPGDALTGNIMTFTLVSTTRV
jgi:hypothetical protein